MHPQTIRKLQIIIEPKTCQVALNIHRFSPTTASTVDRPRIPSTLPAHQKWATTHPPFTLCPYNFTHARRRSALIWPSAACTGTIRLICNHGKHKKNVNKNKLDT